MKNYLLVITETSETAQIWANMSPEEMGAALATYMAFTQRLQEEGRLLAGEGLSQNGKIIRPTPDGLVVTDGPLILGKELIGGFYYFKANSLEEATEIARDCPGLLHGSTVEVREQMEY